MSMEHLWKSQDGYGRTQIDSVEPDGPHSAVEYVRADLYRELISQRDALVEALKSADMQLELAACCIEKQLYNEALLHASAMIRTRRKILSDAKEAK